MTPDLHIALIQSDLHWEDISVNIEMFSDKLEKIPGQTDIVMLPEMFSTGFSMHSDKLAEEMNGSTSEWMATMAKKHNVVITGSFICKEEDHFYNRLLWVEPNGNYYKYDKRHLFRMADEHKYYTAGKERIIINYKGWRICPLICYDLRFPVFSRNVPWQKDEKKPQYDLLFYVANWPAARNNAWETLLAARAIENQCFVAGLNRVGADGLDVPYIGNSAVLSAKGKYLSKAEAEKEEIIYAELNYDELKRFRQKFPVHLDADKLHIDLDDL